MQGYHLQVNFPTKLADVVASELYLHSPARTLNCDHARVVTAFELRSRGDLGLKQRLTGNPAQAGECEAGAATNTWRIPLTLAILERMDRQKRHDEDGDDNQRVHSFVAQRFGSPSDKRRNLANQSSVIHGKD
jgi:hypothetical protein